MVMDHLLRAKRKIGGNECKLSLQKKSCDEGKKKDRAVTWRGSMVPESFL